MTTAFLLAATAAYLLGSIPFGYLLVRAVRKQDIRTSGSGNIGATNVLRSGARGLGVLTLALDAGKGYAAVALVRMEAARHFGAASPLVAELAALAATYAVVGHVYPVWLRGKGGKGVATALGVFLALAPLSALCAAAMFLVVFLLFRYVSLASIISAISFPLFVWLWGGLLHRTAWNLALLASALVVPAIILGKHAANIDRLLKGTEYRFGNKGRAAA
jgi:glycerol-3-phosphate acyltransferase PlsY